ncbi:hypothetical protein RhiirB3_390634 [Rhizophagus irregularis]|nr:hypothetical protein RhiirB3_390634 [Rhizophagus irregularis]
MRGRDPLEADLDREDDEFEEEDLRIPRLCCWGCEGAERPLGGLCVSTIDGCNPPIMTAIDTDRFGRLKLLTENKKGHCRNDEYQALQVRKNQTNSNLMRVRATLQEYEKNRTASCLHPPLGVTRVPNKKKEKKRDQKYNHEKGGKLKLKNPRYGEQKEKDFTQRLQLAASGSVQVKNVCRQSVCEEWIYYANELKISAVFPSLLGVIEFCFLSLTDFQDVLGFHAEEMDGNDSGDDNIVQEENEPRADWIELSEMMSKRRNNNFTDSLGNRDIDINHDWVGESWLI